MTDHTNLIADLRGYDPQDGIYAEVNTAMLAKAADALEAQAAENTANMSTCQGIIKGLTAELEAAKANGAKWQSLCEANVVLNKALIRQRDAIQRQHTEGKWCVDLMCNKCYSADFRFKHTAPVAQPAPQQAQPASQTDPDWLRIPCDCHVQCVAWRVSFNDGKDWTIWETDPQMHPKQAIVQPLYTHSTCVEAQPVAQPAEAPDCRTCEKLQSNLAGGAWCQYICTNGNKYQPAPKVVLWRTE
jgi:hypothetical protein